MKYLFVGDIHNHFYMFKDIDRLDKEYNFDRIIFFGDYVDDWYTNNLASIETVEQAIELKKSNPEKYSLLLGNHELSYLGYPCSGHKFEFEDKLNSLLASNIDLFDLCTSVLCGEHSYICSHAGFSNSFIRIIYPQDYSETGFYYAMVDYNKNKANNLAPFAMCSHYRGGHSAASSCLWCDRKEHMQLAELTEPLISYQIMGHSPVSTIGNASGKKFNFFFIDTHSTYSSGEPFGDKSYLIWDDNQFKVKY